MDLALKETQNQQTVDDLEALADELEQILTLERSSSKEFQRLIQLSKSCYSSSDQSLEILSRLTNSLYFDLYSGVPWSGHLSDPQSLSGDQRGTSHTTSTSDDY